MKLPKDGGAATVLAGGLNYPWALRVAGPRVYWSDIGRTFYPLQAGGVYSVGVDGGEVEVVADGFYNCKHVAVNADHAYYAGYSCTMFKKAIQRELILGNPCTVDKDDLPAKIDKDPEWRAKAIHTRDELEHLRRADPRV